MQFARLIGLVVCLLVQSAAAATDGGVHLYLQPLRPDAAKLTFATAAVSALTVDGVERPLALRHKSIAPGETGRQRLLASGRLPSGRYSGFIVRIAQAALKNDRGVIALTVPDAPFRIEIPFTVTPGRTPVVWLTLRYPDPVGESHRFGPTLYAEIPSRPVAGHAGFVANSASNSITVFDKSLAQAVAVIDTCTGPAGLALDQYRRRLYVACTQDDEIQAIDVVAGEIVQRIQMSPGDHPTELGLTPDGETLLVVSPGSNSVTFIDASSLVRRERVNVGSGPRAVVVDRAGRRAFVLNRQSSSISVIDLGTRNIAATLSVDGAPIRAQFSNSGTRLYVIHERTPYLTVFDPKQLSLVARARLSTAVEALTVDPVRGLISVGGSSDTAIEFYEPNALMPLYSMKASAGVSHLAVDPEDNRLYMVNPRTRTLIIASLADRRVVAEIDIGDDPYWVAVMGEK